MDITTFIVWGIICVLFGHAWGFKSAMAGSETIAKRALALHRKEFNEIKTRINNALE